MQPTYRHTAYGLVFDLAFPCPALPSASAERLADVTVTEGPVPASIGSPMAEGPVWQAAPGRFLSLAGRRTGRFLVEDGGRVTVQRSPAATDVRLARHFVAAVIPAVLRQRGLVVLHATAATTPRGAIVVAGRSGSGKSTTVAALVQRGCRLLSDDLTALRVDRTREVFVVPGVPHLHLGRVAAGQLQQPTDGLAQRRGLRTKTTIPVAAAVGDVPLLALYLLQPDASQAVRCELVAGAAKFSVMDACLYGPLYPAERQALFPLQVAVLAQTPVYRLMRPLDRWSVDEVVDALLAGDVAADQNRGNLGREPDDQRAIASR